MPPLVIAAVVGGAASLAGAAISSHATNKAADAQVKAAADNNAFAQKTYDSNLALSQPSITRGNQAGDLIGGFLGLGGDAAKSKAAMDTYLNSTGYNFRYDEGVRAITGNRAASGILDSGGTLKDLTKFGQGTAASGATDWLNSLFRVSDTGTNAIGAVTGAGTHLADSTATQTTAAADARGNAALVNGANTAGLISSLAGSFGNVLGQSSYKSPSAPSAGLAANVDSFLKYAGT